jgi:hypothetical protein
MKTVYLAATMAVLSLFTACTKDEFFPGNPEYDVSGENIALKNGYCDQVIFVAPNGSDDTYNLSQAFEQAKNAGPGSTVQLLKGIYTIGILEIRDFKGNFKGAGQGKTIITNREGLPCEEEWEKNLMPALLSFVGGNIVMSDMTIRLKDGDPCAFGPINESTYGDLCCAVILADFTTEYIPAVRNIKSEVRNVDFIAGNDGGHGTFGTPGNVCMALYCGANIGFPGDINPLSTGVFTISNCYFEQNVAGPDLFGLDERSKVYIENNTMNNGLMQFYAAGLMGSDVIVRNNKFRNALAADIWIDENDYEFYPNAYPKRRSRYYFTGNEFQSPSGVTSIYMTDYKRTLDPDYKFAQQFNIKENVFRTEDGGIAIQSMNSKDAIILNNKFLGTGTLGVMIDGDATTGTYAENARLLNNNFKNSRYTEASVYLGTFSRNCIVTGVKTDRVVDEGVNNSIIGTKANKTGLHSRSYNNSFSKARAHALVKRAK